MHRGMRFSWILTLLATTLFACGDDGADLPPGNVTVSWAVGTSGCDTLGVESVAVMVEGGERNESVVRSFACTDGGATVTGLTPGAYRVTLRGRDSLGVDRFGGEAPRIDVRSGGTTTLGTVVLSALPASIEVSWYFENGRMCAQNGATGVRIILFDDEYVDATLETDCANAIAVLEGIQAGSYIVDVSALDELGTATHSGQDQLVIDRGDRTGVEIRLSSDLE